MGKVKVGPDVKLGSHDVKLFDGVEEWGIKLKDGPRGIQEMPTNPTTTLFSRSGSKYGDFEPAFTHVEQRTWEGGRGLLNLVDDPTRFYDSQGLWSLTPGKVAPAPRVQFATGIVDRASHFSSDMRWIDSTDRNDIGGYSAVAYPFTPSSSFTANRLLLLTSTTPGYFTDTITAWYLDGDDAGDPDGTALATFAPPATAGMDGAWESDEDSSGYALTGGTQYWLVLVFGGSYNVRYAVEDTTNSAKLANSPFVSWDDDTNNVAGDLIFALVEDNTPRKFHYFEFEGATYAVSEPDDGSAGSIYMNGERGVADDTGVTAVTSTTLVDIDKGMLNSWTADQWNGYWIKITNGTGIGQAREITDTATDGTITVSPAWDVTPVDNDTEYVIYGGPYWQEITGDSLSDPATAAVPINDQVVFCQGDGNVREYMGFDESANPPAHKFRSDADGSGDLLHAFQDENGTDIVWLARSEPCEIRYATVTDYGTDLAMSSSIPVGDGSKAITNIFDYDGSLYVMKTDSLWVVENEKPRRLNVGLDGMPMSVNGVAAASQNLFLYFNWAYSIERYYNGTLDDIGPWKGEGLPDGRQGYISAIAPAFGWLFVAVDAGKSNTSDYSSVLMYNGQGYHEIFRGWAGGRIRNLYFQGNLDTNPILWINIDGEMVYMEFPKYTLDPLNEDGFEVQPGATLTSPTIDLGIASLPKLFKDISIYSENLNSDCYIAVDYQWDDDIGSTTWYSADAVYNSPEDKVELNLGNARKLRYRLRFVVQDADNIPIVNAVTVKGLARTPVKYQWNIEAKVSSYQRTARGTKDHAPNDIYDFLKDAAENAKAVWVRSKWPQFDEKWVIIEPLSIFRDFTTTIPKQAEGGVIRFTAREA